MEPLHTHLLGDVKYFWAQTIWILEKEKKFHIFQARLNSISRAGLNIPNIMADYSTKTWFNNLVLFCANLSNHTNLSKLVAFYLNDLQITNKIVANYH